MRSEECPDDESQARDERKGDHRVLEDAGRPPGAVGVEAIGLSMVADMETLEVARRDHVVTITLNRPEKKNAANGTMWTELLDTFLDIRERRRRSGRGDHRRRGQLLFGGGPVGGGAEDARRHQLAVMRHIGDAALALHRMPKPTIAKVNGVAVGAGCNLALGCDLIVSSDEARFSEIFARRGLTIDFGGSWLLPRLIGMHRAKELALLADIISAKEAEAIGLVNRVVPVGELDAFVDDWATRLAAGPPIALAQTKRLLDNAFAVTFEQALEDEGAAQTVNFGTEDTREAMMAFLEKRDPNFKGA